MFRMQWRKVVRHQMLSMKCASITTTFMLFWERALQPDRISWHRHWIVTKQRQIRQMKVTFVFGVLCFYYLVYFWGKLGWNVISVYYTPGHMDYS